MRASILFNLLGGLVVTGLGGTALVLLPALASGRPILASPFDYAVLLGFVALGGWITVHAMYGAAMQGRLNDDRRRTAAIKAAIRASFEKAKAEDPDLPELTDENLERAAEVIRLDLHRPLTPAEERRADAELGGLKPPSDEDDR